MKRDKKIKAIKPEIRDLLEEFLAFEEYQPIFKQFAEVIGYHGNDREKIRNILFVPNDDGEIGFSISGMNELFLEFQLLKQLIDKEPYKSLLEEFPEAIQNIRIVAQKMLNKEDIGNEDLQLIFDTSGYEKRRAEIDSAKDTSDEQS
jgi:hypothetical protein